MVCLGASMVRGTSSFKWVHALSASLAGQGLRFVNCGRDGDMAVSVHRRTGGVLARHPCPWAAVLLVGTNDILATQSRTWRWMEARRNGLKPSDSLEFEAGRAVRHVEDTRAAIAAAAPRCRVAVVALPPLGEDLASARNARVRRYNAELREAVRRAGRPEAGLFHQPPQLLDLHARMEAHLVRQVQATQDARPAAWWRRRRGRGAGGEALGFNPALIVCQIALARALRWLGCSWTASSRLWGLQLLTDHIHLNEEAGGMLVRLVTEFLGDGGGGGGGGGGGAPRAS